ncbi:MAG: hypothetical protein JSR45_08745 [Proteobacteria bacterium]|nr:hypothetical protein [Pseudomonadota bacterium]
MRKVLLLGATAALICAAPAYAQLLPGGSPVGNIGSSLGSSTLSRTTVDPGRTSTVDTATQTDNSTSSRIRTRHKDAKVDGAANGGANASASVTRPSVSPVTGQVRSTTGQAAGYARGTAGDALGAARGGANAVTGATPSASFSAQGGAGRSGGSASGSASINPGFPVKDTAGRTLGQVTRVVRDRAGQAQTIVVKSADGTLHSIKASDVSVSGGAAVTSASNVNGSASAGHR